MAERGINRIDLLRRRYIVCHLIADLLFSAGLSAILSCMLYADFGLKGWWSIPFFVIIFIAMVAKRRSWEVDAKLITVFLDLKYPDLEESSGLVLKSASELNVLEKMQLARLEPLLEAVPLSQSEFTQRLRFSILFFATACLFGVLFIIIPVNWRSVTRTPVNTRSVSKNLPPEKILPQITSVNVTITPPAYTANKQREQDKFTIEAEEGSFVNWQLNLNVEAKQVSLLFNGGERIKLKRAGEGLNYTGERQISKAGFYQVDVDGKLSDLYPVQVIKDASPVIHIKTPTQYTYIDAGEAPRVNISAAIDDDYGISNTFIYATVAKGSGEAVKFKEQKLDFSAVFDGHTRHYDLQKLISLPALDIEPGDELYFYIQAQDNHNQQSRSDVYIIAMQDTAQLLSMDGLISGVNIKPEYFRSERQIILDSEQLLRERDTISKEAFNTRSNDLGTDQKLLRLRYGKFLGEENESQIDPSSQDNKLSDPKDFGNAAKILDEYTDKHDNAEDAQFFDPAIKAQLKATLTEMWKAELQLRLNKPEAALPFEYKALRLLKDLQQKSRVYVAKTAYNPSPLKMEKRLSGDQDKIIQPVNHQDIKAGDDVYLSLKNTVGVLEQLKVDNKLANADRRTLQLADLQLSEKASAQPELYLTSVSALRHILSTGKASNGDIGLVERAIQKILPAGKQLPGAQQSSVDMGLSQGYYKNLNGSRK